MNIQDETPAPFRASEMRNDEYHLKQKLNRNMENVRGNIQSEMFNNINKDLNEQRNSPDEDKSRRSKLSGKSALDSWYLLKNTIRGTNSI